MPAKPPPPPAVKAPASPAKPRRDLMARALANHISQAHGEGSASTLDQSEELGTPRGFVPTWNVALERALGSAGLPLGRITEISGWEGAGKSTMLDQVLAACQAEGGLGVLADTERARSRSYMESLNVQPSSLVWCGGRTVEDLFDEVETFARTFAGMNAQAWHDALARAGVKMPKLGYYTYAVFDPHDKSPKRKPTAKYTFAEWGRHQAAALMQWQKDTGAPPTGVRDAASRAALRPVVLYGDNAADNKDALSDWASGRPNELAIPADRPVVIGWDSVAGTPTEAELQGAARDQHPATAAKVIRRSLRRLVQLIDDEAIAFVMVNQRYETIDMGGRFKKKGGRIRPASETYGGGGIKYHSAIRVSVERRAGIWGTGRPKTNGFPPVGHEALITVHKNKVNDPWHSGRFGLMYGRGAVDAWAIYEDLKERGIIGVSGGWSKFTDSSILGKEDRSFRGWGDVDVMMGDNPELAAKLRAIYCDGR